MKKHLVRTVMVAALAIICAIECSMAAEPTKAKDKRARRATAKNTEPVDWPPRLARILKERAAKKKYSQLIGVADDQGWGDMGR